MNVLLTGYTVSDKRGNLIEYSTYVPSVSGVSKSKTSSGMPYMTPQSPVIPPTTNPPTSAGFQLQLVFQRNTLTVNKYVRARDASVCVCVCGVVTNRPRLVGSYVVYCYDCVGTLLNSIFPRPSMFNTLILLFSMASSVFSIASVVFARIEYLVRCLLLSSRRAWRVVYLPLVVLFACPWLLADIACVLYAVAILSGPHSQVPSTVHPTGQGQDFQNLLRADLGSSIEMHAPGAREDDRPAKVRKAALVSFGCVYSVHG